MWEEGRINNRKRKGTWEKGMNKERKGRLKRKNEGKRNGRYEECKETVMKDEETEQE